jgi:hypothetical protein
MTNTEVTDQKIFLDDENVIALNVSDTKFRYQVQLVVNGDASEWYGFYSGLLVHKGYIYASAYWEGELPIEQPFAIRKLEGQS